MKKLLLILLAVASIGLAGCGEQGVDQSKVQNPSKQEMDAAKARKNELIDIYNRAGGKWENLTPQDLARVIELSNGNAAMAQQGWPALGTMTKE